MNTVRLKQSRALFIHPDVPIHLSRHNIRAWIRSVRLLGSRWHLSKYTPHRVTVK